MNWLLIAPILLPFGAGLIAGLVYRQPEWQRGLAVLGALGFAISALFLAFEVYGKGPIAAQMGNWAAPFGITLVADLTSALFLVAAGIAGFAAMLYAVRSIDAERTRYQFYPLMLLLLSGIAGAFLTGDIFNLYVWFEIIVIGSFGLLVLGGDKAQLDGAVKYVTLNLLATTFFLMAVGLLYGMTGTLNMADLAVKVPMVENQGIISAIAVLFLLAFGMKAGMFPLFFWLPAAYHTPPAATMAVFAALLSKVGVYALIRTFTLIFDGDLALTHSILMVLGCATALAGVIGAGAHGDIRRILGYNVIASIGFMLIGLATYNTLALAGALLYAAHSMVLKPALFLSAANAQALTGSWQIEQMGGLYRDHRLQALLFLAAAFALIGFPPFSGLWGKLALVQGTLGAERWIPAAVMLLASLLTILPLSRIWMRGFQRNARLTAGRKRAFDAVRGWQVTPVALLMAVVLLIGIFPAPAVEVAVRAAEQLIDPSAYIQAVLGADAAGFSGEITR